MKKVIIFVLVLSSLADNSYAMERDYSSGEFTEEPSSSSDWIHPTYTYPITKQVGQRSITFTKIFADSKAQSMYQGATRTKSKRLGRASYAGVSVDTIHGKSHHYNFAEKDAKELWDNLKAEYESKEQKNKITN